MFSNLVESGSKSSSLISPTTWGISTILHVAFLAAATVMASLTAVDASPAGEREQVTYVNIAEIEEPAAIEAAEPADEPAPTGEDTPDPVEAPEPEAFTPEPPPTEVTRPDLPAGFQELVVPEIVEGIPDPTDIDAAPVRAEDFRGRGVAGGVAGGRRALPFDTARETGEETETMAPLRPEVVDVPARMSNLDEVRPMMSTLYPPLLRDAGIPGRVVVEFVVTAEGLIDPETIRIIEASDEEFEEPTRALLQIIRWEPARRRDIPVPVLFRMPIQWTVVE